MAPDSPSISRPGVALRGDAETASVISSLVGWFCVP
jgi:hypothetical protein